MHTNPKEGNDPLHPSGQSPMRPRERNEETNPGYEVQDVNVGGIITFLAGLCGFLVVFFVFCFVMGKAINTTYLNQDGPADKWHGGTPGHEGEVSRKREDLTSNAILEQREFASMTQKFPTPRLETDDGNQDTADLHSREDLLLENYSTAADLPSGTVRIPIDRAMQLIAQRGLPMAPSASQASETEMAGDARPVATAPLTDGFARTGYELDQMTAREQRVQFNQAEARQ